MKHLRILLFLTMFPSALLAESRIWTNKDGKTIIGEQIGIDAIKGTIQLKAQDGKTYSVPMLDLSKDDIDFARTWKYPPSIFIDLLFKKVPAGHVVAQNSSGGIDIKTDYADKVSIEVRNLSKSPHAFVATYIFLGSGYKTSEGVEDREITYLKQIQIPLDPNESTTKPQKPPPKSTTDPFAATSTFAATSATLTADDPFGLIQDLSNKEQMDNFVVIISCEDNPDYFQAKSSSITLEQYAIKNAKSILNNYPTIRVLTRGRKGRGI